MSDASARIVWSRVGVQLRHHWRAGVLAFACLLAGIGVDLLMPWPLKLVVDHVLLNRPVPTGWGEPLGRLMEAGTYMPLAALAGAIALLAMLSGVFAYLQSYLTARIGFEIVHAVRVALFARLQRLPLGYHARTPSGEIVTRIGADAAIIRDVFADWLVKSIGDVLLIVGVLAVLVVMDWRLALLVAATLPALYVVLRRVAHAIRVSARELRRQDGEMAGRLNDTLGSIALIQAFGREGYEDERFTADSARSRDAGVRNARAAALVSRSVGLVAAFATAGTVLAGGAFALRGTLSPGDLLVFVAYVTALFKPVRDLGKLWAKFARARASAERLGELLATPAGVTDREDATDPGALRGEVVLERVTFGYGEEAPVLADASVRIAAGEHVAVIGRSGAGKSTLLKLLLRLEEPQGGTLRLDGHDLPSLTLGALRREVGVVLQDAALTGATIAENIRYGRLDATDADVEHAARLASIHDFIVGLPAGYGTIVGERGALLSGGQRQRLSLARTLIRDPAVLILDEPTSAVDPASVRAIDEAVALRRAGRTTLVIGHQFGSFDRYDRVLEVRDGRIHDVTLRVRSRSAAPLAREGA